MRRHAHSGAATAVAGGLLAVLHAVPAAARSWAIETVDSLPAVDSSSLRVNAGGETLVAFAGDSLRIATGQGASWSFETVPEPGCAVGVVLALDPADEPVLAYYVPASSEVRLARRAGPGNWSLETVANADIELGAVYGAPLAMDLGPAGEAWIASRRSVLHHDGTAWVAEPLPRAASRLGTLRVAASGDPWLAYQYTGLEVAHRSGATWVAELVDVGADWQEAPALDVDAQGFVYVAYHLAASDDLWLALWDGVGWSTREVESAGNAGRRPQLRLDGGGWPVIIHQRDFAMRSARFDGSTWSFASLAGGDPESLDLDPAGRPRFSYSTGQVASHDGSVWDYRRVLESFRLRHVAALALDSQGRPSAAWVAGSATRSIIHVSRHDGSDWQLYPELEQPAESLDLAVDASGSPLVAFSYSGGILGFRQIWLARYTGSAWTVEAVEADETGDYHRPAIAIDEAGNPALSYTEDLSREARFAQWNGSSWERSTVGVMAGIQYATDLGFDRSGRPAVAFDRYLARWDGLSWVPETALWEAPGRPRLVFAADGEPGIAGRYFDGIQLAERNGFSWSWDLVSPPSTELNWLETQAPLAYPPGGRALVAYVEGRTRPELTLARTGGTGIRYERIAGPPLDPHEPSLAIGPGGEELALFIDSCHGRLLLARGVDAERLHRGLLATISPGWKAARLPLASGNDDETAGFPKDVTLPFVVSDTPPSARLVLYRALGPGDLPLANRLLAVRRSGGVEIRY